MDNRFCYNNQVGVVATFSELVNTDFEGTTNALCWNRSLDGDFKEIVTKLQLKENITEISIEDLLALQLSEKGVLPEKLYSMIAIINRFRSIAFS